MTDNISAIDSQLTFNSDNLVTFNMDVEGDLLGTYRGTFIIKAYLNPLEILAVGRTTRELLGNHTQGVTQEEFSIALALSECSKRIVKAPPFWSSNSHESLLQGNIPDLPVLHIVYTACIRAESLYRERLKAKRESALKTSTIAAGAILESLNGTAKKD